MRVFQLLINLINYEKNLIYILTFITNFSFPQVSTKELTDKYLGFNNFPKEVRLVAGFFEQVKNRVKLSF